MKKILFFVLILISFKGFSQSTVLLRGDTIKVYKQGDTATLKVEGEVMITHYKLGSANDSILRWNPVTKKVTMSDASGITGTNIYNSNGILTGNRTLTGLNNTYGLNFDSLNYFKVRRNNVLRLDITNAISKLASIAGDSYAYATTGEAGLWNDNSNMIVHNDDSIILNSVGSVYQIRNIPYNSSTDLLNLVYDSTNGRLYRQVGGGGGSGTINSGTTGKPAYYVGATTLDDFAAVDYATSGTNMLLTTQNTTDVGLNIKAASSQTANLQNWSSSAGTGDLASLTKDGYFQSVRGGFGITPSYALHVSTADIEAGYFTSSNGVATRVAINHASNTGVYLNISNSPIWSFFTSDFITGAGLDFGVYSHLIAAYPLAISGVNNYVGLGTQTIAPERRLHLYEGVAATNTVSYLQRNTIISGGTVAAGFGVGSENELENASGTNRIVSAFETIYTDATNATEDADIVFKTIRAGALTEAARITGDGAIRLGEIAAPSTPASATAVIYAKSDGLIYGKDDAGVETKLSNDAGGTPTLQQVLDAGSALGSNETITVGGNQLNVTGSSQVFQVGSSGGTAALNVYNEIASTNTITPILRLQRATTGTGAIGEGGKIQLDAQTTSGITEIASLDWALTNATHANRTAQVKLEGISNAITDTLATFGGYVNLTESSATQFTTTTIGTGKIQGGSMLVTIEANDATDFQARTMRFIWSAVNKAGTLTITISTPEEVVALSSGTLTCTITAVDAGSGVLDFKANAVSSLTQSTLRATYQTFKNF